MGWGTDRSAQFHPLVEVDSTPRPRKKSFLLSITNICKILDTKYTFHMTCKNKTKGKASAKDIFQVSMTCFKSFNRKCRLHKIELRKKSISADSAACEAKGIFSELGNK